MSNAQPRLHSTIRRSTDADLAAIHVWLEQQDRAKVAGTFLCNWRLTAKAHREGDLLAYIDPVSQVPVAYQWGGLLTHGILEVRNDMRGRGIGKALVEHCMALASAAGEDVLSVQCAPDTSIPFWQAMGFTMVSETKRYHHDNHA